MHSDNQRLFTFTWIKPKCDPHGKTGKKVNARVRQIDTLNVESEKKSFLRSRVLAIRSIHWNKRKRRKFAYSYQQQLSTATLNAFLFLRWIKPK